MMKKPYPGSGKHDPYPFEPSLYPTDDASIFIHFSTVAIKKESLVFIIKITKNAYGKNFNNNSDENSLLRPFGTSSLSL